MVIEFDAEKREKTLVERGLDFADSAKVFAGLHFVARDDRFDYGEERFITVGYLVDRIVCACLDTKKRYPPHNFHEVRQ